MKRSFVYRKINCRENLKVAATAMLMLLLVFVAAITVKSLSGLTSQVLLLFCGWMTWTFTEYYNHRFRMHGRGSKDKIPGYKEHIEHHHHPAEIKITSRHRLILVAGNIVLLVASVYLHNLLTFFTGLYSGFVIYCFMHVILHQRWSVKVFPILQEFHIHHHCKYPNHCFGVSVTWWDIIFNTKPPKEAVISKRIREFYFGNGH